MYPKLKNYSYNYIHLWKINQASGGLNNSSQSSESLNNSSQSSGSLNNNVGYNEDQNKVIQLALNNVKKYIDNYYKNEDDAEKFNKIINLIDPFRTYKYTLSQVYNVQFISSTWLNLWEIITQFSLIPSKLDDQTFISYTNDSFGSCISVINHYIKTMTFIKSHLWYSSGDDNEVKKSYSSRWITDSKMNKDNINTIVGKLTDKIHLYVSDISSGCNDYINQEISHMNNNLGQILLGLKILNNEGSMILKIYTVFNSFTKSLIQLLTKCFKEVYIVKPYINKSINGDVFLVCNKYTENKEIINILEHIDKFDTPIESIQSDLDLSIYEKQIDIYKQLIKLYESITDKNYIQVIKNIRLSYVNEHEKITLDWSNKYPIYPLKSKDKLKIKS